MDSLTAAARLPRDPLRGRLLGWLTDRLIAADPAASRARLSGRAILSLMMSTLILALATLAVGALPMPAYGLGAIASLIGSVAVSDLTARGQAVSRLYAWIGAVTMCVGAGMLAPWPRLADGTFLAVIFVSVYIRRFGIRWTAVGMLGFFGYFMGEYLKARWADLPWILFGGAVAMVTTHVSSVLLLPDDPERDFRRALATLDRRINLILRYLLEAAEEGHLSRADERIVRRHSAQLRDIFLMAEGFILKVNNGSWRGEGPASDLAIALFDLQLAVERLVRYRHMGLPSAALLRRLLTQRGHHLQHEAAPEAPAAAAGSDAAGRLLWQLRQARARINLALGQEPSPAFEPTDPAPVPPPPAAPGAEQARRQWIRADLRRPIQVTLACGIALGIGLMFSPTRWFWAVLTAFIVFNNTKTRADTVVRAMHRTLGTLLGVLVGIGIATLLQGHPLASWAALPALLFCAFYFLQTSYGTMIFFLTIALALIYGLLGMFTPQLLVLRLVETLVGGVSGAGVAFLVFPIHSSGDVELALNRFFDALQTLGRAVRDRAEGQGRPRDPIVASRTLDRCYADLAAAVRPLGGPWSAVTRFGHVREKLLMFVACAHWARILARAHTKAGGTLEPERRAKLEVLMDAIHQKVEEVRPALPHWFDQASAPDLDHVGEPPPEVDLDFDEDDVIDALEAIDSLMDRALAYARAGGSGSGTGSAA